MKEIRDPKAGLDGRNKALGLVDMQDDAFCIIPSVQPAGYLPFPRLPIARYRRAD